MYCKYCGEKLFEGQTICVKCGHKIEDCKHDNNNMQSTQHKSVIETKRTLNGKNKTLIMVLCLTLGFFGAHNFIMGENKKGIVKIIASFFSIGIILAVIDFIKIITDKYVYNSNAFI